MVANPAATPMRGKEYAIPTIMPIPNAPEIVTKSKKGFRVPQFIKCLPIIKITIMIPESNPPKRFTQRPVDIGPRAFPVILLMVPCAPIARPLIKPTSTAIKVPVCIFIAILSYFSADCNTNPNKIHRIVVWHYSSLLFNLTNLISRPPYVRANQNNMKYMAVFGKDTLSV